MNNVLRYSILVCLIILSSTLIAQTLQYCVPVSKFDFNPYREIKDGKELAYLLLLRPYISNKTEDRSILEAYNFSPDGKIFTAKLSRDAVWSDGAPVNSKQAALGIANGFLFRPIGERVQVVGVDKNNLTLLPSGVRIIDNRTFELTFVSNIENLTGVIREALTAGSRHNKVWPVRLEAKKIEVLTKNKISFSKEGELNFLINKKKIELSSGLNCLRSDFTIYPELIKSNISLYISKKNNKAQACTLQLNTLSLDLETRKALSHWIRNVFKELPLTSGVESVKSFFLEGESGYKNVNLWDEQQDLRLLKGRILKLGVEIPVFKTVIEVAAKRDGMKVQLFDFPLKNNKIDGQILSSGIHEGRQIILQDILKWNYSYDLLKRSPRTMKALNEIAKLSASTMPPDSITLQNFEFVSSEEKSLIPLARRYVTAYSNKETGVILKWNDSGELVFE